MGGAKMGTIETKIDVRRELAIEELVIAQLLTDEYNLKILSGTADKSMSVRDMAFSYFIPLATCYRKVAELESAGLLRSVRFPSGENNAVTTVRWASSGISRQ